MFKLKCNRDKCRTYSDLIVVLLLYTLPQGIKSQLNEGERCMGKQYPGDCRLISNCVSALEQAHRGTPPVICGYEGKESIVCCENEEAQPRHVSGYSNQETEDERVLRVYQQKPSQGSDYYERKKHSISNAHPTKAGHHNTYDSGDYHSKAQPHYDLDDIYNKPTKKLTIQAMYERSTKKYDRYDDNYNRYDDDRTTKKNNRFDDDRTTKKNNRYDDDRTTRRQEWTNERTTKRNDWYNNEQTTKLYNHVVPERTTQRNQWYTEKTTKRNDWYNNDRTTQHNGWVVPDSRPEKSTQGYEGFESLTKRTTVREWPTRETTTKRNQWNENRRTTTNSYDNNKRTTKRNPVVVQENQNWFLEEDRTTTRRVVQTSTQRPSNSRPSSKKERVSEKKCSEFSRRVVDTVAGLPLTTDPKPVTIDFPKCIHPQQLIVGGENTTLGEFPHMAAVGFRDPSTGGITWECGGSLISDQFVLTAAHCTSTSYGPPLVVRLGELNLKRSDDGASPRDYYIQNIIKHPQYKPPARYNDIALLQLSTKVSDHKHIRPACLYTKDAFITTKTIATGWGRIAYAEAPSDTLLKVGLNIIDSKTCNKLYRHDSRTERLSQGIVESQLCAGELQGGKDTCQGDSGGPIEITSENNDCVHYIIGVTSFGKSCAQPDAPGVYTRVSAYVSWIESVVWPQPARRG